MSHTPSLVLLRMALPVLLAPCLVVQPGGALAQYVIQELGPSDRTPVTVAINNRGDLLLGLSSNESGPRLLRIAADGSINDLSGLFPLGARQNNHGVVAGVVEKIDGKYLRRWENGEQDDVIRLPDRADGLVGFNDSETFVAVGLSGPGAASFLGGTGGSEIVDLGDLGEPTTFAQALSETGLVVGASRTGATVSEIADGRPFDEAFLFDGSLAGLGTAGGISSLARGVNSAAVIVGETATAVPGESRAFVYDATNGMRTLALEGIGSSATDINDEGTVVGTVIDEANVFRAFVAAQNSQAIFLEDLTSDRERWTVLSQAFDINQRGQIVGVGSLNGETRAFLATPVPEPFSSCTVMVGWLVASVRVRRASQLDRFEVVEAAAQTLRR